MFKKTLLALIVLSAALGVSVAFAAWSNPLHSPPTCNEGEPGCDAPINVGPKDQAKLGNFSAPIIGAGDQLRITKDDGATGNGAIRWGSGAGGSWTGATAIRGLTDGSLQFVTNSLERMRLGLGGRLRIGGVETPLAAANLLLDVEGRVGATEYCDNNGQNCKPITDLINGGDGGGGVGGGYWTAVNGTDIYNNNAGNVGIGTGATALASKLTVKGQSLFQGDLTINKEDPALLFNNNGSVWHIGLETIPGGQKLAIVDNVHNAGREALSIRNTSIDGKVVKVVTVDGGLQVTTDACIRGGKCLSDIGPSSVGDGVTKIIPGSNITVTPSNGLGEVTVSVTGNINAAFTESALISRSNASAASWPNDQVSDETWEVCFLVSQTELPGIGSGSCKANPQNWNEDIYKNHESRRYWQFNVRSAECKWLCLR